MNINHYAYNGIGEQVVTFKTSKSLKKAISLSLIRAAAFPLRMRTANLSALCFRQTRIMFPPSSKALLNCRFQQRAQ